MSAYDEIEISFLNGVYRFASYRAAHASGDILALEAVPICIQNTIDALSVRVKKYEKRMRLFDDGHTPERIIEAMLVIEKMPSRANGVDRAIYEAWRKG